MKKIPLGTAVYPEKLTVSPSPHIKNRDTTQSIMTDVLIALLPALIWGVYYFGWRALLLSAVSVASCVFFEFAFQKLARRPVTVRDMSAAVTGLLLAFNVPVTLPVWMIVLAGLFAIVVVKQLFGGIGKNIVNPALAARVFLLTSFVDEMSGSAYALDGVASATPLVALKTGDLSGLSLKALILGRVPGCIGEVSTVLLLAGGLYLLCRRVITWHIPAAFVGVVALLSFLFPVGGANRFSFMVAEVCAGGLILGAVYMATDYATSPVTPRGRLLYGGICGLITVFIRRFCGNPEGVSYAILISNLLVYYLDKITLPRRFGAEKRGAAKKAKKEERT